MSLKNRKYKLKKIIHQSEENRKKQMNFNNRFTTLEKKKHYDALEDPHASYYFVNPSVRNHLKNIKRATIHQTTHLLQKQRLKKLFNQKIRYKPRNYDSLNRPTIYQLQQLITNQKFRRASLKSMNSERNKQMRKFSQRDRKNETQSFRGNRSLSKKNLALFSEQMKQKNIINNQEEHQLDKKENSEKLNDSSNENEELKGIKFRESQEKKQAGKKARYIKLHQHKHKKFISFIEQKKKLVLEFQKHIQINKQ